MIDTVKTWRTTPADTSGDGDGMADDASRPLVLIVDDEALNRRVLGAMLQQLGYRYDSATNGREAVEAARQGAYAAVLMDCLMPELDGYDATRAIRQDERERAAAGTRRRVPVIAVTAVAFDGARERCIAAGMDDYLSKPVVKRTLAALLERWTVDMHADAAWTPEHDPEDVVRENELIDARAIDSLRDLGGDDGEDFVASVVRDFLTDVASRFQTMRVAGAHGDRDGLTQALHSIAGCAAMVGAVELERVARSLQVSAPTVTADSADALIDRIESLFVRTSLILETYISVPVGRDSH